MIWYRTFQIKANLQYKEVINMAQYALEISRGSKLICKYIDTEIERFMPKSKELINEFIDRSIRGYDDDVENTKFHIYQIE